MNDNVAIAVDESGEGAIVTGKGLGYATKVGSLLHERLVRSVYSARGDGANRRLQALFSEIPNACIEVAEQIEDVPSAATGQKLGKTSSSLASTTSTLPLSGRATAPIGPTF